MDLLRIATAGSVDDGKSTLIGRMLYDSKAIFDDQLSAVEAASSNDDYTNLALLTDGLRAEREQGITIDVAYRYFATPKRKFIIADTPGHVQYTRNMVTGASTADLAMILVDARKGVVEQSRRHTYLCSLLRVPQIVLCVNKMDLVDWSAEQFTAIATEFRAFAAASLPAAEPIVIPIAALSGDNVVRPSENMPWYTGVPLLESLETASVRASGAGDLGARLPVQYVIQDGEEEVAYAGQMAAGCLYPGQQVTLLPSGVTTRIASVDTADGTLNAACPPMSISVRLADQVDLQRGDMICSVNDVPPVRDDVEAIVCWMDETKPLTAGASYTIKHTTRVAQTVVSDLAHRIDVNDVSEVVSGVDSLQLNEIGRVRLQTSVPLMCDDYGRSRATGGFVLIDNETNRTVAGGIVV